VTTEPSSGNKEEDNKSTATNGTNES